MKKINHAIQKINLASRLKGIYELATYLKSWRTKNTNTFRLDGHHSIGPANPAQHLFFEIQDFADKDYQSKELGEPITGKKWNGIYYLTASTRCDAIDFFLTQVIEMKNSSNIFRLTYTTNKEGNPTKRKLLLENANHSINSGWFCKQYNSRY